MILEHAVLTITPGREAEFEAAFERAPAIFEQAHGCDGAQLHRCLEEGSYLLLVVWDTLDDHVDGFRNSALFTEWRALVGPYFDEDPQVTHYDTIA